MTILVVERVMGIEPTYLAWKASVLPLNYTRKTFRNEIVLLFRFGKADVSS